MNRITIFTLAFFALPGAVVAAAPPPSWPGVIRPEMPAPVPSPLPGAAQTATDLEVAKARENLRISQLTYDRIRANLEKLRQEPEVDPAVLRDYSIYLDTVRDICESHEKTFAALTTAVPESAHVPEGTRWVPVDPITFNPTVSSTPSAMTLLDRELDDALAAFDAFILEEQYEARRRRERDDAASSEELTDLAREAAAAVERLRKKGIDVDTSNPCEGAEGAEGKEGAEGAEGSGGAGGGGGAAGAPGSETRPGETPGGGMPGSETPPGGTGGGGTEGEDPGAGAGGSTGGGEGTSSGSGSGAGGSGGPGNETPGAPGSGGGEETPSNPAEPERSSGEDDDIVARQLREAAERETDPVLKEKLWEEYERYKRSS